MIRAIIQSLPGWSFALGILSFSAGANERCFDFSEKIVAPLRAPLSLPSHGDAVKTEVLPTGLQIGEARGVVSMPIRQILKLFEDPYLTKNRKNTVITKTMAKSPYYLWVRSMHLKVSPVFFVTVEWDEDWAVALRAGTASSPQSFIVYYQKTAGTGHVKRLCGSILVTALDSSRSDVSFVEEVRSSHWTAEDAVRNFGMTLKIFRGEHKDY